MKQLTREELTAITFEEWNDLSLEEQGELRKQGNAFRIQDQQNRL